MVCKLVTLHGEVSENGPGQVAIGKISTTTSECSLNGALVFITKPTMGDILLAKELGVSTFTFKYDIPASNLFECHHEGPFALGYVAGTDDFSIPGGKLTGSTTDPMGCINGMLLQADFTLEDEGGGAVTID